MDTGRLLQWLKITVVSGAGGLALVACGSTPTRQLAGDGYDDLYDGKSQVAYGTELPAESPRRAVERGDDALAQGDLDRALFNYIQALEIGGGNAGVLYKIGAIHAARRNTRLAEIAFRWALTTDQDHGGALAGLGVLMLKRKDYTKAREYLERAVAAVPGQWRAHNALGVLSDLGQDFDAALAHYERALASVPGSTMVMNNIGYSRYLAGDWKGAEDYFRRVLVVDPSYELAWRNLGLVQARQGRYAQAVEAFERIESLPEAYNDVGYVSMVAGRLDDAQAFFDQALRLAPSYYETANENTQRVRSLRERQL
jgi:tetratricopeptide (TPR) repeat protein